VLTELTFGPVKMYLYVNMLTLAHYPETSTDLMFFSLEKFIIEKMSFSIKYSFYVT